MTAWVPVCVLGPMNKVHRLDLQNAVAAFTGRTMDMRVNWGPNSDRVWPPRDPGPRARGR